MSFKEKVDNYFEEQRGIKEAEEKAVEEVRLRKETEKKASFFKEAAAYRVKVTHLIEALNKTPIQEWFQEIKAEEGQLQNGDIDLYPEDSDMDGYEGFTFFPKNPQAKIKLVKSWTKTHPCLVQIVGGDNEIWEDQEEHLNSFIGIKAEFNNEQKIQFSSFSKDDGKNLKEEEKTICLADDPKCNEKIESSLIAELIRLRK